MTLVTDLALPPSVNHCYINVTRRGIRKGDGRPFTRRERQLSPQARAWMDAARYALLMARRRQAWVCQEKGVKVVVQLWVRWGDARVHDTHNLHKLIADALEGIVFENDQYALMRDMDFTVDRDNPGVKLVITRLKDMAA